MFADETVIRAALMDVLDQHADWDVMFWSGSEIGFDGNTPDDVANSARLEFADAVQKRILELQSPPHNLGVKLENYCPRHMRLKLPFPTVNTCVGCDKEQGSK